jgi:putative tricarboxylic transport membrane protein
MPSRALGLVVCAASLVFLWETRGLSAGSGGMDAALWPRVILVAMLASGVYLLASRTVPEGAETIDASVPVTLAVMGATIAYGLLLPELGYLATTIIFLLAMTRFLGGRSRVVDLAVAVGGAVVLHLIFGELLGVRLPVGPLEQLFGLG